MSSDQIPRNFEIKGGAGELEAAVIAVVLDHVAHEEAAARRGSGRRGPGLPAWVRAVMPDEPHHPQEFVWPE